MSDYRAPMSDRPRRLADEVMPEDREWTDAEWLRDQLRMRDELLAARPPEPSEGAIDRLADFLNECVGRYVTRDGELEPSERRPFAEEVLAHLRSVDFPVAGGPEGAKG